MSLYRSLYGPNTFAWNVILNHFLQERVQLGFGKRVRWKVLICEREFLWSCES